MRGRGLPLPSAPVVVESSGTDRCGRVPWDAPPSSGVRRHVRARLAVQESSLASGTPISCMTSCVLLATRGEKGHRVKRVQGRVKVDASGEGAVRGYVEEEDVPRTWKGRTEASPRCNAKRKATAMRVLRTPTRQYLSFEKAGGKGQGGYGESTECRTHGEAGRSATYVRGGRSD